MFLMIVDYHFQVFPLKFAINSYDKNKHFYDVISSSISLTVFGHFEDKTSQVSCLFSFTVINTSSSIRTPIPANSDRVVGKYLLDRGI